MSQAAPASQPSSQAAPAAAWRSLRLGAWLVPASVSVSLLVLYAITLAPGLLPADAGEYQLNGAVLGISHPPGFALYTLASWLAARAPWTAPATAINFLSAVLAALTLGLLSRAVHRLTASPAASALAALALGFSTTFWAQATTANIRMPAALAAAWALERLAALHTGGASQTPARLAWLALAIGLGVAHHGSLAFMLGVLGLFGLWWSRRRLQQPRALALAAAAGLLPFLSWLYFPLRGPIVGQPRLATADGFLEHVLARGFAGDMFHFASWSSLQARLAILGNILTFEFTWPVLLLAAIGLAAALWRDRPIGLATLAAAAVHVLVAITYRAPQTVEYLMPAYVLLAAWAGYALATIDRAVKAWAGPHASRRTLRGWVAAGLAAVVVLRVGGGQLAAVMPSYVARAQDQATRQYAASLLEQAPPDAVILSAWHMATPLWYLQRVEGLRPDVEVHYVFPQGHSLALNWVQEITGRLAERPVVVTNYYAAEYAGLPYRFVPLGPAWQVLAEPLLEIPPGMAGRQQFGNWTFLGYRMEPGEPWPARVQAAWQLSGAPEDISFFVHLIGPDGALHSQHDVSRAADSYLAGEVLLDRYSLPVRPDAAPGDYVLVAGAYRPDGTRLAETPLATLRLEPPGLPRLRVPDGAIPLGSDVWLADSRLRPAGPLRPGDSITVQLNFIAARPINADYVVGVSLVDEHWRWRAQSDGIPAGGAIPTLKWIAGSRIRDTHTLRVPQDAQPGKAYLSVTVYDFFTQQPLGILDPALAAAGPAVPLGTVEISAP
jgi:hypothetical protein